jgi:hypothetical protein
MPSRQSFTLEVVTLPLACARGKRIHGGVTTVSGDLENHDWKSLWRRRNSCGLAAEFLRFLYTVGSTLIIDHLAEGKFTPNP